jgi:peroxiredoxin
MLEMGHQAPDLRLPSTGGEDVQLSKAFASHRATILAFYVLDFTPGWKTELTEFRSRIDELTSAGIGLYGVSVDSVFSHKAFAEQLGGLPFELLADFERRMVEAYGVRRDDVPGYSGMPQRSVFIVDPAGVVRWTWVRTQQQPLPDFEQVIAEARKVAGEPATG